MHKNTTDYQENYIQAKSAVNWDEYFMLQAIMASFKSKDPATKVGCVFVDQNNECAKSHFMNGAFY